MGGACNSVIGTLNFLLLIVTIAVMMNGVSVQTSLKTEKTCEKSLEKPLIIIGAALFIVSLLGFITCCCNESNMLFAIYSFMGFIVIVGFIGFTIFSIFISNIGNINNDDDFIWNTFVDDKHWNQIKLCLTSTTTCHHFSNIYPDVNTYLEFNKTTSSPIQWGCCRPPVECRFKSINATLWMKPKNLETKEADEDEDCTRWSNQQNILCYNCESCREAAAYSIRRKWELLAIQSACFTVLLIFLCSLACCARNNDFNTLNYYLVH